MRGFLCHTFCGPFSGNFTIAVSQLSCSEPGRTQASIQKKIDENDSRKISSTNLGSSLGSLRYTATEEEIETMISVVDADGNRCISLDEFVGLNTKDIYSDDVLENLKEAFSIFDIDKNRLIPAEEVQTVLRSLGDECSIAECKKMTSGVDTNDDGMISFEEFRVTMIKGSCFDALEGQKQCVKIE
ncbi:hypothetical protein U1Q18_022437 [Sarracenia purpurea var. burkii]